MKFFYVKQFNLYYGGMRSDAFVFANDRRDAVALATYEAAEKLCEKLGNESCEIEERIL